MLFKKRGNNDGSSYDDYYYDYYYDEEDNNETNDNQSQEETTELKKRLGAANQKIQQLQNEKETIELQYSAVKALPKHYEELEKEKMNLQLKLQEVQLTQNSDDRRVSELEGKLKQSQLELDNLKLELEAKQQELDKLSEKLLNLPEETNKQQSEVTGVIVQDIGQQKEEIANVLLEARAQARQIIDQANYQARHKMVDAENELKQVQANASSFYRRVEQTKFESDIVFEELLGKLSQLSDSSEDSIANTDNRYEDL